MRAASAATLEADLAAAMKDRGISGEWTAAIRERHTRSVVQGAFVLAKAGNDPALTREGLDHLDRYIRLLLAATQPVESADMKKSTELSCACGQVHLEVEGTPIVNAACCCNSCRAAGARLQALPSAPPILGPNGDTRFVLYRKDRIRFVQGSANLQEVRLTPESKTRRVVATCCNTPVFLELQHGHWLSLYGCLWPASTLPALEMRTMTMDLPADTALPDDVPNAPRQSVLFFVKLLSAWIAMGFRSPKIAVNGELHV